MKQQYQVENRCIEACLLGKGPTTVLFFHGFGSSAAAFPRDELLLTQHGLQLLCINRPGVGGSTLVKNYSLDDIARDAKAILDHLTITQCVVAGWSAGGLFAQAFAQAYPPMVLSLHLVSSAIPFANPDAGKVLPGRWKSIRFMNRFFPFAAKAVFKSVSKKAKHFPDGLMQQSIKEMAAADKEVARGKRFYPLLQKAAVEGFANEGKGVFAEAKALGNAVIDYRKINCPVHIWTGVQDTIWPRATAFYLHHRLPQSSLHINRSNGHLFYLKEWEKLIGAISLQTA